MLRKKSNHNRVRFKLEMAVIPYINSPAKIPRRAVVRSLNNFSAQADLTKNRTLENCAKTVALVTCV